MTKLRFIAIAAAISAVCKVDAVEKLIVLNEGTWQNDNGRVTYFEDGKVVSNQWFRDVNKNKIGDTPNDIIQVNDNLIAISVNWSNIVQFITPTGKAVAAIEKVPNNRKLASDGRYVYVTSYGHECATRSGTMKFTKGFVAKIDITDFTVVTACEVGYEPEGIALYNGKLFIANTGGYSYSEKHDYETTVSVVDAETMTLIKDIDTGQINLYGNMSQSGKYLCINSAGDYYYIPAATIILDCESGEFAKLDYAATYNCTTTDGKFMAIGSQFSYLTNNSTFNYITIDPATVMSSGPAGVSEKMPGTMISDIEKMTSPYGIYVNPYTGYIYATDASSYEESGLLYQWSPQGKLLGKFKTYINPAHFLALPPDGRFSGVENVVCDDYSDSDAPIYNFQGIRVTNPRPGVIYVRNGHKFVFNNN